MSKFTILIYEDDEKYVEALSFNLSAQFSVLGLNLEIKHRVNGDSVEQDLQMIDPDIILIDHDLGTITGEEIIEILDSMPEHTKVMLLYYSGGESLDDLNEIVKKYKCHIQCFTKEGDELEIAIMKIAKK